MSLLGALLLASATVHAQPTLANVGDCAWVHGRYVIANGSMIHRIWMIGTHHELNLDVADEATPAPLRRVFQKKGYEPWRDELYADFFVCPRVRRIPGHMQRVHLNRLKNMRIVTYPGS